MIKAEITGLDELINKTLPEMFNKCVRHTLSTVFTLVIPDSRYAGFAFGSPVRSGQFYNNHFVSIGTPSRERLYHAPAYRDNPNPVLPPLSPSNPVINAFKLGQIAYITNNVEYAAELERGKSSKAPKGIYRVAAELTKVGLRYEDWNLIARM